MPRDGSGNYGLPAGNPVVTNTTIATTWANNTLSDVGAALTQSMSKDGQTVPTANLSMGNFRLTALAAATARTDAPTAGQIQDSSLTILGAVAGTDTITATLSTPSLAAYAAGQTFRFGAVGVNTTTSVTLNINGLGAKAITKNGANPLAIGDLRTGAIVFVTYDGAQFQMNALPRGLFLGAQIFTASGTYTKTPGATTVIVRLIGGAGAGGGAPATGTSVSSVGAGGGSGAYCVVNGIAPPATAAVVIGAGGVGVSGAAGNNGGSSSFNGTYTAAGGVGGTVAGPSGGNIFLAGGGAGGSRGATGTLDMGGTPGGSGLSINGTPLGGTGGSSAISSGAGNGSSGLNGGNGTGYGVGGGGSSNGASAGAQAGGSGTAGLVIVEEYA